MRVSDVQGPKFGGGEELGVGDSDMKIGSEYSHLTLAWIGVTWLMLPLGACLIYVFIKRYLLFTTIKELYKSVYQIVKFWT